MEQKILLVDDRPEAAEASIISLENFVKKENIVYVDHATKAMEILEHTDFGVVFLDIDMPETSGFGLAAYLEENFQNVPYVFLTGYADFALESYEYNPVDFLTKPVTKERLKKTFEKLDKKSESRDKEQIMIKSGQDYIAVCPEEIQYISKEKRKIVIHLNDKEYQVHTTLDELEKIFEDYGLFRCHQSFLIPLKKIVQVNPSRFGQTYEAVLKNQIVVPVSRNKYSLLKEKLKQIGVLVLK